MMTGKITEIMFHVWRTQREDMGTSRNYPRKEAVEQIPVKTKDSLKIISNKPEFNQSRRTFLRYFPWGISAVYCIFVNFYMLKNRKVYFVAEYCPSEAVRQEPNCA